VGAFGAIALAWLLLVGLSWWARLGPLRTARSAFFALPFMLAAVPLLFAPTTEPLVTLTLGPLTLTIGADGLERFVSVAAKSWVSVQAALLLAFTTPFHDLIDGLRELRLPRILIAIIGFMYRYLGVIGEEAGRMNRAKASRSAVVAGRGGGSLRWRGSVTGHMVGSLFLRSYERSERVYAAMQARGFDGTFRSLPGPPLPRRQLVAFGFGLVVLVVLEASAHAWRAGA
jgi:cobalt/nickel transport system permease protein